MDLKTFLTILKYYGYPNPNLPTIAKASGYNLDRFLEDLKSELGQEGVDSFCQNAINKISTPKGFKVNFGNNEFIYCKLEVVTYDEDESENDVIVKSTITESKIFWKDENGNETYESLDYILDEIDMSTWGEYDDMIDNIQMKIYEHVFQRCGFGLWFQ